MGGTKVGVALFKTKYISKTVDSRSTYIVKLVPYISLQTFLIMGWTLTEVLLDNVEQNRFAHLLLYQ